jgi:RNA polymerase sigma-70 factor (ECF subfamily)
MTFSKSIALDDNELGGLGPVLPVARDFGDDFVASLKAGDAAAFNELITRYSGDIYRLLIRLTDDREEAADLTQETFLNAFRSAAGFRGESSLKTWLFRIAVNQSRNRHRWWQRRRRDTTYSLEEAIGTSELTIGDTLSDGCPNPEQVAAQNEQMRRLRVAIRDLPQVYREAIILCDVEGLSYDDIALALEINLGTVKSRIARGREELRRKLCGY